VGRLNPFTRGLTLTSNPILSQHIAEEKKADRGHMEMYFFTRAMAFFVG